MPAPQIRAKNRSKRTKTVNFFEETPLTPEEVERRLQELEAKYHLSSEDFRTGEHAEVSEDDQFEWLAYLDSRRQVQAMQEDLHRAYLSHLSQQRLPDSRPWTEEQFQFAA
jgi:hypothetical protein